MLATIRWIVFLAFTLSMLIDASAQTPPRRSAAIPTGAQDVNIIIQSQHVRFTTLHPVDQMHLRVADQTGEVVFDSGGASVLEIFWPLHTPDGAALKSGLYAYTLTVKETQDKEARVRRGHFIVDRAQDRDGTDKLWVTSRDANGVGTELTVSKSEDTTVAGTRTAKNGKAAKSALAEDIPDGEVVRSLNGLTDHVKLAGGQNITVTPEGDTVTIDSNIAEGQVVKGVNGLTDQVTLEAGPNVTITPEGNKLTISATGGAGVSGITELNGNVGIGTTEPTSKLTVQTPTASYGVSHTDGQINLATWVGAGATGTGGWFGTRSNHALHFFTNDGGSRMTITPEGNVGIGTNGASSRLTIEGQDALAIRGYEPFLSLGDLNSPSYFSHRIQSAHGDLNFFQGTRLPGQLGLTWTPRMVIKDNGHVGIGTATPIGELHLAGYGPFITLESRQSGTRLAHIQNADGTLVFKPAGFGYCCAALVMQANTGNVGIGTGTPQAKLDVAGRTRTGSLEITGGADFAEHFDVNLTAETAAARLEAGMVVSIDPSSPGKLQLSAQAYDRRVAGIISGAGGVKPGMTMSQEGTLANGQYPVALSGRVYCWVDATPGAIEPGDLLTTAAVPGHAMKANDAAKAQGAIIGKAMTGLKEGRGLVLVLVSLQ